MTQLSSIYAYYIQNLGISPIYNGRRRRIPSNRYCGCNTIRYITLVLELMRRDTGMLLCLLEPMQR